MDKRLGDINDIATMSNEDKFLIIVNGREWLITKENLQKVFTGLTSDQRNALSKIVLNGNGTKFLNDRGEYTDNAEMFNYNQFKKNDSNGLIELIGYHKHNNQETILDKFSVDESGALFFDDDAISAYTLPAASSNELGGVKVDGVTITIDENGTIHGANTYELPISDINTLGGVKIDGDTIKINNGVISADVIGNWAAGVSYPVGYFSIYDDKLYQCITANNDNTWDESKWQLIGTGSSEGTSIGNWSANILYKSGDLIIYETTLYQCNTEHTSDTDFDETESAYWTALSGEKGEKGDKGEKGEKGEKGDPGDPATNIITGVKGASESVYRTGNINLTADNIGARMWRKAVVGQSSNTTTNPYYKFASYESPDDVVCDDTSITFKVSVCCGDKSTKLGILTAHTRTNESGYWESSELIWEYANSGIDTSKFIIAHNTSENPAITELWVIADIAYAHYHFDVISEGKSKISNNSLWTLYDKSSTGSDESVTSGYEQQTSTLGLIKNSITGNSSTATKLVSSSATTITIATTDWATNSSGGYMYTYTLSNPVSYTNFNFDVILSTDPSAAKLQLEAWGCVVSDGMITQTNSNGATTAFTFYSFTNKPSVELTIAVQGVS